MQKDELFRRMDARLRRLDFAELWPGFRRYPCALYDREGVCLEGENLPPEKDWFANTAVCFRGKWTAIWNVEVDPPGEDMDLFTANLVHEMFHCYQYEMGESRWPDEREMLLYPMEEGNLRARRQELRLLARGAAEEDRAAFEAFREMRRLRKRLWPRAVEMESRAECVEGAAEYVGLKALEALAPAGAAAKITQYAQELAEAEEKLLDPRRTAYVSGCLLLKCAEQYAGEMERSLHMEKPYFDLLPESEETAALLQAREAFLRGAAAADGGIYGFCGGSRAGSGGAVRAGSHEQLPAGRLDPLRDAGASEKGFRGRRSGCGSPAYWKWSPARPAG